MTESTRPKRVVIVDAENPMEEIHGEFFWREDHDRLLAEARDAAFADGYAHGWTEGSQRSSRVTFRIRRRPRHLLLRTLFLLAAVTFVASLIANIVH